jgi:hypothetical protein
MKVSKQAKTRMRLMTMAEKKKVLAAARVLFDFQIISAKRADMLARTYKC